MRVIYLPERLSLSADVEFRIQSICMSVVFHSVQILLEIAVYSQCRYRWYSKFPVQGYNSMLWYVHTEPEVQHRELNDARSDWFWTDNRKALESELINKQECIPVGYVPSAAVAVWRGGWCLPGSVCPDGRCLSRGCLPGGCLPRGCLPGGVCLWWGCLPRGVCLPDTPPPCEQNNRQV